jgi:hypothetical protein
MPHNIVVQFFELINYSRDVKFNVKGEIVKDSPFTTVANWADLDDVNIRENAEKKLFYKKRNNLEKCLRSCIDKKHKQVERGDVKEKGLCERMINKQSQ